MDKDTLELIVTRFSDALQQGAVGLAELDAKLARVAEDAGEVKKKNERIYVLVIGDEETVGLIEERRRIRWLGGVVAGVLGFLTLVDLLAHGDMVVALLTKILEGFVT